MQVLGLIVSMAVALAVGAVGGLATASSVTDWYTTLHKPWFNPPNALFAPVWTLLYILMGVAAWLVWRRRRPGGGQALALYGLQLLLNLAWPLVFFGLHSPRLGLVDIAFLLVALLATIVAFYRIDRVAAVLLLPLAAWTAFAAALNAAIWRMN
jgi:benzodiazapine receptor